MKKLGVILIGIFLSISVLGGCSISFGVDKRAKGERIVVDETVSMEGIDKIKISTGVSNVTMESYDGDEVKVTGHIVENASQLTIDNTGGVLKIEEESNGVSFNLFSQGIGRNDSKYKILIPSTFNGDLDVNIGIGETYLCNLDANLVNIYGGAGELVAENFNFNKLDVNAGVGELDLSFGEKAGDVTVNGGVGEVKLDYRKVSGNLNYNGGVGSCTIVIPKEAPVFFKTSSGIGNCDIDAKTSGENTYKFELQLGIGEIQVRN